MEHQPFIRDLVMKFYIRNVLRHIVLLSLFLLLILIVLIIIEISKDKEKNNFSYKIVCSMEKTKEPILSFIFFSVVIINLCVGVVNVKTKTNNLINNLDYDINQIIVKEDFSKNIPKTLRINDYVVPIILSDNTKTEEGQTEEPYVVILERKIKRNQELYEIIDKLPNKDEFLEYEDYIIGQINY